MTSASPQGTPRSDLRSRAWWIAGVYGAVALLWILFSDLALALVITDPDVLSRWGVAKGLVFVVVTAVLLLHVLRRVFGRVEEGIAAVRAHEAEIQRLGRLHAALTEINQAIVRLPTRDELFTETCRALVEHGGFAMAWIGWHDADREVVVPVASWGDADDYWPT